MDLYPNDTALFQSWYGNKTVTQTDSQIMAAFLGTVGLLAVFGNSLVILVMLKYRSMRTPTNMLIIGLVCTDLTMVLCCFPLNITSALMQRWMFGHMVCQSYGFIGMLTGYASIGMLMLISIDRYISICRMDIDINSMYKHYALMILCVWINAAVWAAMPLFGWGGYGVEPTAMACTISWWNNNPIYVSYVLTVLFLCYITPIAGMVYCYAKSIVFIKRVGGGGLQENLEWTNQKDITKMCFICVICFLIAWSPYAVICLWAAYEDPSAISLHMSILPALFAKASAMFNPVVYVLTNKRFRAAIYCLFTCKGQLIEVHEIPLKEVESAGRTKGGKPASV